ncbi:MAG TPA: cell division protein FtsB [Chromatiales bacterium]|nr:cell division protein FtsB [Chromatiales bacterium]
MERRPLILRISLAVLALLFAVLQLRLWGSDDGFRGVQRLREQVSFQRDENARLKERNERLEAEVIDLRKGFDAVEERARSDLGLIEPNETFYVLGAADADSEHDADH